MEHIEKAIHKMANAVGFDIYRVPSKKHKDIDLYYDIYGKEAVKDRRFYNIGTGEFRHPAWTNVDHEMEYLKDKKGNISGIYWELLSLTPIPLEDKSAKIVYSSHTIEHITDEAAQNMFSESYRILKRGGFLRVTAPDIDLDFRAYKENDRHYFHWIDTFSIPQIYQSIMLNKPLNKASIQQIFLWHFASSASTLHADGSPERISDEELDRVFREMKYEQALNHCISKCSLEVQKKHPGDHINWWNKDKLFPMLRIAGFDNIYLSGYGQSFSPVLRNTLIFDNTLPKVSLYFEAIK